MVLTIKVIKIPTTIYLKILLYIDRYLAEEGSASSMYYKFLFIRS